MFVWSTLKQVRFGPWRKRLRTKKCLKQNCKQSLHLTFFKIKGQANQYCVFVWVYVWRVNVAHVDIKWRNYFSVDFFMLRDFDWFKFQPNDFFGLTLWLLKQPHCGSLPIGLQKPNMTIFNTILDEKGPFTVSFFTSDEPPLVTIIFQLVKKTKNRQCTATVE